MPYSAKLIIVMFGLTVNEKKQESGKPAKNEQIAPNWDLSLCMQPPLHWGIHYRSDRKIREERRSFGRNSCD